MAQYSNTVSFQPPSDFGVETQANDRQRKLAEAMMMRSMQPQAAGQMVGNQYVPQSWTQGLANAVQGPAAMYMQKQADEKAKDIATRQREAYAKELTDFAKLTQGTPAQPEAQGNNPSAYTPPQAAVPGDRQAALAMALGAQNPQLQQYGISQLMPKEAKWEKIELPNPDGSKRVGYVNVNSPEPISTFQSGGTAPVKLEGVNTGGNTTFVNPYSPQAQGAPTVGATGNPYKDLLVTGPGGQPMTNAPMLAARKDIAQAGKATTNVNVNTAPKAFLGEIGKGVGEQVVNDFAGGKSAVQTMNNVAQIEQGLKNVIVGPGAGARVKLSQIGQILGVNGKDATEQLQNTRNVMQGLARQELSAAGQMKGQGQITESERGILRRAEAGDISELTVPEIQTLLGALKKTSAYRINQHNQNLQRLEKDPNAAGVADYMRLPEMPSAPSAPAGGGFRIIE
jgi:hypothetical protein